MKIPGKCEDPKWMGVEFNCKPKNIEENRRIRMARLWCVVQEVLG